MIQKILTTQHTNVYKACSKHLLVSKEKLFKIMTPSHQKNTTNKSVTVNLLQKAKSLIKKDKELPQKKHAQIAKASALDKRQLDEIASLKADADKFKLNSEWRELNSAVDHAEQHQNLTTGTWSMNSTHLVDSKIKQLKDAIEKAKEKKYHHFDSQDTISFGKEITKKPELNQMSSIKTPIEDLSQNLSEQLFTNEDLQTINEKMSLPESFSDFDIQESFDNISDIKNIEELDSFSEIKDYIGDIYHDVYETVCEFIQELKTNITG